MNALAAIFDETADQEIEDLFQGISNRDLSARACRSAALLRDRLRSLEIALARLGCGLTVYNGLAYAHEYTSHALETLASYFQSVETDAPAPSAPLEPRGAHNFAAYVPDHILEIRFMAEELDHDHASGLH
jgi:hypothetical protein